jgi:predicted phage terminase large subunit-like protein
MLMSNPVYKTLFYAIPENFGSLWPGKWPESQLRKRHAEIGSVEFNRGFRNKAVDVESQMVPTQWIAYDDLSKNEEFQSRVRDMQFICSYDTANAPTGSKEQDYSASVIIAVDQPAGMVYVIDAWHARCSLKRMEGLVWLEAVKYKPFRIVIEKAGQASLHEWVVNEHPELGNIVETATPKISKALRLMAVTPLMERKQVVFSQHLDPNAQAWHPGRGSLTHELEDFPFAAHDDMVDAFSQALWWARRYFLDAWAVEGQNGEVNVSIGSTDGEQSPYMY